MTTNSFFISLDGDLVGQQLEKLIITNELNKLIEYSHSVNEAVNKIRSISDDLDGKTYLHGGDSLLVELQDYKPFIEKFLDSQSEILTSFSVGIGRDVIQAYLALKFAKSAGRGLIVLAEVKNNEFEFKEISRSNIRDVH